MSNNAAVRPNIPAGLKALPPLANSIRRTPPVQETPPAPPPPPPVAPPPPPAPPPAALVEQTQDAAIITDIPLVEAETYLSVGSKETGFVEFDLMSHREKGKEVRYLQIQTHGFSLDDNDRGAASSNYMAVMTKEDFEKVKGFFATLTWED